jgi:hypothetical protein
VDAVELAASRGSGNHRSRRGDGGQAGGRLLVGVACGDENENGGRGREEQTELGRVEYKKEVGKSGALSWGRERL